MQGSGVSYKRATAPPTQVLSRAIDITSLSFLWKWVRLIEEHSRTRLTYCSDRLVTIAGLARMVYDQMKGDYVASMWRKRLILQLA